MTTCVHYTHAGEPCCAGGVEYSKLVGGVKAQFTAYAAPNGAAYSFKVATPTEKLLALRLKNGAYKYEDGQLLKRCSRCKEHWPADSEFFYSVKDGDGLNEWCKACYQEWRYPNGRAEKHEPD